MNDNIEIKKKKILEILFSEKDILNYKYFTYLEQINELNTESDIVIWIHKYRYIFTKYGREDIDKLL